MVTDVIVDIETGDPDDAMTVVFMAAHPRVNLRAVTVHPGTRAQVGFYRKLLGQLGHEGVPIGAAKPDHPKKCVSSFYYGWLGDFKDDTADGLGWQVIGEYPEATVICGGPLFNLDAAFAHDKSVDDVVIQGGFCGDNLVAPGNRLPKFAGKVTCPTYNLNGNPKAALRVLARETPRRTLVGKNICHGIMYDHELHKKVREQKWMKPLYDGMDYYLSKHPEGKKFHDPFAACVALNRDICTLVEAEVYREKGMWGSRLRQGTNTYVAVAHDYEVFLRTFLDVA